MPENHIQLFGEDLNTYPNQNDSNNGLGFSDDTWESAETGNSTVKNSGFLPNSPVSSIALNTALKQASVGAKIIGDILADTDIGNVTVSTDNLDSPSSGVSALSSKLTDYLSNLHKLLTGDVSAGIAKYALTGSPLDIKLNELTDNIINQYNAIKNGNIPVNFARYYKDDNNNSVLILNKFKVIDETLTNLGRITGAIAQAPGLNGTVGSAIQRTANVVSGSIRYSNPDNNNTKFEFDSYSGNFRTMTIGYITDPLLKPSTTKTFDAAIFINPTSSAARRVMLGELKIYNSGTIVVTPIRTRSLGDYDGDCWFEYLYLTSFWYEVPSRT